MTKPSARTIAILLIFLASVSTAIAETVTTPAGQVLVVDGDTVRLQGERLRLLSIDAPETHQAHCRAERRAGLRAKARLEALLRDRVVSVRFSGRTDRYGRPLVDLETAEGDLGTILLGEWLALPYVASRPAHQRRIDHWCPPVSGTAE